MYSISFGKSVDYVEGLMNDLGHLRILLTKINGVLLTAMLAANGDAETPNVSLVIQ